MCYQYGIWWLHHGDATICLALQNIGEILKGQNIQETVISTIMLKMSAEIENVKQEFLEVSN